MREKGRNFSIVRRGNVHEESIEEKKTEATRNENLKHLFHLISSFFFSFLFLPIGFIALGEERNEDVFIIYIDI